MEERLRPDFWDRPAPSFRREGAYALLVFLHAQTLARAGWDRPDPQATLPVSAALDDAAATLVGMTSYQSHPFVRSVPEVPVAWRRGSARVLDFGGDGPSVLIVPSMINGSQIMDLSIDLSPLRWLARQGFRVFQIDWGIPGPEERRFDLGDFLEHRLSGALDTVARLGGEAPHLVGYCMGGPLMLALAQRSADRVNRIVTLGAPWDFSAFPEYEEMREKRAQVAQTIASLEVLFGVIPPQTTQSFFALRDLASGVSKFRRFAALDPMSAEARRFVAVEDWLNDGVPLPPKVGRECFLEWIADDAPRRGEWAPSDAVFDASDVSRPALVVSAQRDTVVHRAASEPLANALPDARLLRVDVGHIGMVVGTNAIEAVWRPMAEFLRE